MTMDGLRVPEGMTAELLRDLASVLSDEWHWMANLLHRWADDLAAQIEGAAARPPTGAERYLAERMTDSEYASAYEAASDDPFPVGCRVRYTGPSHRGRTGTVDDRDRMPICGIPVTWDDDDPHPQSVEQSPHLTRIDSESPTTDLAATYPVIPEGHEVVVLPAWVSDEVAEWAGCNQLEAALAEAGAAAVARRPKPAPETERVPWAESLKRWRWNGERIEGFDVSLNVDDVPVVVLLTGSGLVLGTAAADGTVLVLVEDGES